MVRTPAGESSELEGAARLVPTGESSELEEEAGAIKGGRQRRWEQIDPGGGRSPRSGADDRDPAVVLGRRAVAGKEKGRRAAMAAGGGDAALWGGVAVAARGGGLS
uniref:Uncharacterized protein n=1 Tax=Oryza sativa subsp. indica TaxID=39946 RepID=A0A679BC87_ORYSI|nr:hypothetical protein [Oryza sativa Indica Group]